MKFIARFKLLEFAILSAVMFQSCGNSEITKKSPVIINKQNSAIESRNQTMDSGQTSKITDRKKVPKYKLLHEGTTYCDFEILVSPINLKSTSYKDDVKAILDDLAHRYKRTNFTAWFYDNPNAAALNYTDLELGKRLSNSEARLVNYHIIACYGNTEGYNCISYFENIPTEKRSTCVAWKEAFDENEFNVGYNPTIE